MRPTIFFFLAAFATTTLAQDSFSLGVPSVSVSIADPTVTGALTVTDSNNEFYTIPPSFTLSNLATEAPSVATFEVTLTVIDTDCNTTPTSAPELSTTNLAQTKSHSNGTATASKTVGGKVTTALLSSFVSSTAPVATQPLPSRNPLISGAGEERRLGFAMALLIALVAGIHMF